MIYDLIIIGGGPAGLFAAANIKSKKVLLIEKKDQPGKKLLMAGGGQCNYTNNCHISDFLEKYADKGRFIKPALYNFTNEDAVNFFEERGLKSIAREDDKIFPHSLQAKGVLNVLVDSIKDKEILLKSSVKKITYDEYRQVFYIKTDSTSYTCENVIISTGGMSYPTTGSTGDGYKFAESLGHRIVKPRQALTPVYVRNYQFADLSGMSFENIKVSLWKNNKKFKEFTGDFLFTHVNISGPLIINNSRYMEPGDLIKINFTSLHNEENFRVYFENLISSSTTTVKNLLREVALPRRFTEKILEISGIDENLHSSQLTRDKRKKLIRMLSAHPMEIEKLGPYNMAMVTKGGVSTDQVNSKTMESKKIPGLYFAGEVLDYDGDTGGFNIQGAFSTGKLAADDINKKI